MLTRASLDSWTRTRREGYPARRSSTGFDHHPGHKAIQALPGVSPVLGAVFVAEIGDVTRFTRPQQLRSWAA
jgi:transposase